MLMNMRMKGQPDINIHEKMFILIGAIIIGLIALTVIYVNLNPTLSNTPQARASLTAHTLAFYLGSLSSVDMGAVEKNLNETYIIQIGKYSGLTMFVKTKPVSDYFIKVLLYDEKGKLLAESEEVSFIANLDINCQKSGICLTTDKVSFLKFTKPAGEAIKLEGFKTAQESGFSLCPKVGPEDIEKYVGKYGKQYKVEKSFVLAVMGAESYIEHCDRYGFVKTSKDKYGNPVAFGLMQVTPSTAKMLESEFKKMFNTDITFNIEDPEQNVNVGVFLLSILLKNYEGYDNQKELAAANYNCSVISQAVSKYCGSDKKGCWNKIKPHLGSGKEYCTNSDETVPYVDRVMRLYACFDACLKTQNMCYTMESCKGGWEA